jgi:hypothetical protein
MYFRTALAGVGPTRIALSQNRQRSCGLTAIRSEKTKLGFHAQCPAVLLFKVERAISSEIDPKIQKSIHPDQKYPNSCKPPLSRVLIKMFPSRNEKNHLHSFFCGCRIRDGSGTRGYGAFFSSKKGPELPWGVVQVNSFRSVKAIGLSPRSSGLVSRRFFPSLHRGLNVSFALRFEC